MTTRMTGIKLIWLAFCFTTTACQEYPTSSYAEIKQFIKTFKTNGVNTSTYYVLSIDENHNNLLVGARNNAFLVNLDNMDSYVSWNVLNHPGDAFVKLMLPLKDRILLCWIEKQYSGSCSWKNRTNLNDAPGSNQGFVFKSDERYDIPSSSPDQNDTAIITEDGTLFTASQGRSIIYSKRFKQPQLTNVFTSRKKSAFYDDVDFVKSFEIAPYVYFFFRERTLEYDNCGKFKISRVARICKGDRGGKYRLENKFVTFQKAKLSCDDGEHYPFSFNEIQDVWWDNHTDQFHAVFTTQPNAPATSAICIYSLSSINRVFDESPFESFQQKSLVQVKNNYREYFQGCKVNPKYLTDSSSTTDGVMATTRMTVGAYVNLMHDPLMADAVQPVGSKAWFIRYGVRVTSITLDDIGPNVVVYASTDRGSVMKISQLPAIFEPCLLSEMEVYPSNKREVIKTTVIDRNLHVLYLGSRHSLTKLSLEHCHRYLHDKSACISAADPYCGWDDKTSSCVSVISRGETTQLLQNLTVCPKAKEVGWSSWKTCVQNDGNLCRCQARRCQDGPDSSCTAGVDVRFDNCTVDMTVGWEGRDAWETFGVQHGNWSVWGNWSECSVEAWAGVRKRSRTCTNPAPRRGGRPCVGEAIQYEPCSLGIQEEQRSLWTHPTGLLTSGKNMAVKFKVTSKAKGYKITDIIMELSNQTIDCEKDVEQCEGGKWDRWGNWSLCSVEGYQIRRRNCSKNHCIGERLQERRCSPTKDNGKGANWDRWSDWSLCSVEGFQIRRRNCSKGPCIGERLQERRCTSTNDNCAEGVIDSSWDAWSNCVCNHGLNVTEGTGLMYRIRKCHRACPNVPFCNSDIKFKTCSCAKLNSILGRQRALNPSGHMSIGLVIGAAVVPCVVVILLCVAAICFVHRRKKQFDVSKTEERSFHDSGSESKFSTLPTYKDESLKEPLSPSRPETPDKNRNNKIKIPLKLLPKSKRKTPCPVDCV